MLTKIEKAISKTVVNTTTIEINLPDNPVYYSYDDNGRFFPEGLILFAIIPKYENANVYYIYKIINGCQYFTDFHPSDCKDEYFLDYKDLRHKALDILTNINTEFKEISKELFDNKRMELLNYYKI